MIVYAESSAVLAWLFDQARGRDTLETLERATLVVASVLTEIECARVIARAVATGSHSAEAGRVMTRALGGVRGGWSIIDLHPDVVEAAKSTFPVEPIRALDAIHVASAKSMRDALGSMIMLSLDDRVRANAAALGLTVLPAKA